MPERVVHETYLPFTESQLLARFAPIAGDKHADPERHLAYYRESAARLAAFQAAGAGGTPQEVARARQMERDERFWLVAGLLALYHSDDPQRSFCELLGRCAPAPAVHGFSWEELLSGRLELFFEVALNSPVSYREWLAKHLDERTPIPYQRERAERAKALEGATKVDALLIAPETGAGVLFEAKVISDCSATISFDVLRNQLARNIDIMLEAQTTLQPPLDKRIPERSCFVLLTPELYRNRPESRLYGWLMSDYRDNPQALSRDLPHRNEVDWTTVAPRLGWATFEDIKRVERAACPWLGSGMD